MCIAHFGPIPVGSYYIFDRQSGGTLGSVRDLFAKLNGSDKSEWFALYAVDKKIDDEILCEQIIRGNFRIHPKGLQGISNGCVTIEHTIDWYQVRSIIKASQTVSVEGTSLKDYGRLTVQ